MASLLTLTDRETGRSIVPPWPPPLPNPTLPQPALFSLDEEGLNPAGEHAPDPTDPPVNWGIKVLVTVLPVPVYGVLHCWGVGPSCGGLAAVQPQRITGNTYEWTIGTPQDIRPCHAAAVNECWLTDPGGYVNPPPNFGHHQSTHTSRAQIAEVIPLEARLACLLSTPPPLSEGPLRTPPTLLTLLAEEVLS